jgi:Serine aminopeptidase, S33
MENSFGLQHEVALPIHPMVERRATPRHSARHNTRAVDVATNHQSIALAADPLMRKTRDPQSMALDWDVIAATVARAQADSDNIAPLPGIDHSGFATFKRVLRFVAKQSPALAARLGTRVLTTPPKARPKRAHAERIALATQFPLNLGGISARGYAWGSGPAVIFSHGWCADASWFAPYITQLNLLGFQVVAFDAPGHGFAARGRTDMFGFAACIGGASDWVMANGGRVQAVVGHSFGAVAAAIAMRDSH